MNNADLFGELVATYRKHGWELHSVLLQPATLAEIQSLVGEVPVKEADFDALWFSRPSHQQPRSMGAAPPRTDAVCIV